MKNAFNKMTFAPTLTLTALALVLAAPHMAAAKSAPVAKSTPSTTSSTTSQAAKKPAGETIKHKTGEIDSTVYGEGTWSETITKDGGVKTIDKTITYADGQDFTLVDTRTKDGNHTVTNDSTWTNDTTNKVTTTDENIVHNGNGTATITGTRTQADGSVDTLSGTRDKEIYGSLTDLTLTNVGGQVETLDTERMTADHGNVVGRVVTGTNFNGQAIDRATLSETDTKKKLPNDVTTTVNGTGIYSEGSGTVNGTTTINQDRVFANGAGSGSSVSYTPNGDGSYDVSRSANSVNANGQAYSSTFDGTLAANGAVSGNFTQSNGHEGTVDGQLTKTNYGSTNAATYTDQNGATKTVDQTQLVLNGAVLNVNQSTTFNGQTNNSAGLLSGVASNYVYNNPVNQ